MTVACRKLKVKVMGQANAVSLTSVEAVYSSDLQSQTHAKGQCQKSLSSKDRMERCGRLDRQADGPDCITFFAEVVGKDADVRETLVSWKTALQLLLHSDCVAVVL